MKSNVNVKLAKIQQELKVKKSKYNAFGKYYYRSAEDIMEAIKPFNEKYDVNVTVDEEFIPNETLGIIKATAIITDNEGGNMKSVSSFAGIEKAGAMAIPQAFGSASSYAKKYALNNLFLLDDSADADTTNKHTKAKKKKVLEGDGLAKAKVAIANGEYTKDFILENYEVKGTL